MLQLAVPVMCSYGLQMGLSVVSVVMVGHLGVEFLDGAALGSMTANVTGMPLLVLSGRDFLSLAWWRLPYCGVYGTEARPLAPWHLRKDFMWSVPAPAWEGRQGGEHLTAPAQHGDLAVWPDQAAVD